MQVDREFREAFEERQMEILGLSLEEVRNELNWKHEYSLTQEQHEEWVEWGVDELMVEKGISREEAEKEICWLVMDVALPVL